MSDDHLIRVQYRRPGSDIGENRTTHEGEGRVRVFVILL